MNIMTTFILALALMLFPVQGRAEFYKYKDAGGVWHFTDNMNEVPEEQRPDVGTYTEAIDALTPMQKWKKQRAEEDKRKPEKSSAKTLPEKKKKTDSPEKKARLEKKKSSLEHENATLVKEQQALLKFNINLADETRLKVYKIKVARLNKRIEAYERKRQAFELEVAKFHVR